MYRIKSMLPYLLITGISYYALPLLMMDTGSAIFILLMCLPLITFACALTYGAKFPFDWKYAAIVSMMFTPTVYLYYNSSAAIYAAIFYGIALAGNVIGRLFFRSP